MTGESTESARLANLCCGHLACQREVADLVAAARADEQRRCLLGVVEALEKPMLDAWTAYIDGPGGKIEALRQGKYEGIERAYRLAVNAINAPTNMPEQQGGDFDE